MSWYSLSVSVSAGATVIESPVWMPIGSRFSMEQTMMALSARSRTTSISNSFQPSTDSSTRISPAGEASMPAAASAANSARLYAMPPPVPPSVYEGRMMVGSPTRSSAWRASSRERAIRLFGHSRPISLIASRNASRSSAISMAARDAPISATPCSVSVPSSASASAVLSAVCPPMVGSRASGFSAATMRPTISGVIGST